MLPIINRGTWARVYSVRSVIQRFLTAYQENDKIQIVSLGAGLDITYFWILDLIKAGALPESLRERLTYVEVDYHDVVASKI